MSEMQKAVDGTREYVSIWIKDYLETLYNVSILNEDQQSQYLSFYRESLAMICNTYDLELDRDGFKSVKVYRISRFSSEDKEFWFEVFNPLTSSFSIE